MSDNDKTIDNVISVVKSSLADGTCKLIYAATERKLNGDTVLVMIDFPTDLAAMQYDSDGLLGEAWLGSGSIATVTPRTAFRAAEAGSLSDAVFLSHDDGMYHDIGIETAAHLLKESITESI